jgi:CRP-like cAMP-binding protein
MLNISDNLAASVVRLIELSGFGQGRQYKKGRMLLRQGDKVDYIITIKSGTVKTYSILSDGRVDTYGLLGKGGLVGIPQFLLDEESKVMIEAIEDTDVILVSPDDFQRLLSTSPQFSLILMKKLARDLRNIADKAEGLGFLNVQERLKRSLSKLAEEHGTKTDRGICINLDITHKEIGELIGANRTTITYFVNQLKRQGYLFMDGRHFVISRDNCGNPA